MKTPNYLTQCHLKFSDQETFIQWNLGNSTNDWVPEGTCSLYIWLWAKMEHEFSLAAMTSSHASSCCWEVPCPVRRGRAPHPQTLGTAVWRRLSRDLLQHKTRIRFPESRHKSGAPGMFVITLVLQLKRWRHHVPERLWALESWLCRLLSLWLWASHQSLPSHISTPVKWALKCLYAQ